MNASILTDSGGPCECPTGDGCVTDPTYNACLADVQRDLITTTAAIAALASFLMGLLANLPVGMAPGLGLNAYVSIYTIFVPASPLSHISRAYSRYMCLLYRIIGESRHADPFIVSSSRIRLSGSTALA